jgi:hypothetical protein
VPDQYRAGRAQPGYRRRVHLRRRELRVATHGGDVADHVEVVLHRDRHAQQRGAFPRVQPPLRLDRLCPRLVGPHHAERVQLVVDRVQPSEHRLQQVRRGHRAVAQGTGLRVRASPQQLVEVHADEL